MSVRRAFGSQGIEDFGMKFMYAILSVAGWVWLVIAVALLWWRISLLKRKARPRGFDVVPVK